MSGSQDPTPDRIESFSLEELKSRLSRALHHREKLDTVARLVELEQENEELEVSLARHIPELETGASAEPVDERPWSPLPSREKPAATPPKPVFSSLPVEDEIERPEGWRGERIERPARIHEKKRLEILIEREAREAGQIRWIRWLVTAIVTSIAAYSILPIHLLYRNSEYAALFPSNSRRLLVRGNASLALALVALACLILVGRALLLRYRANRRLMGLSEDVRSGQVVEELIQIKDLSLVNDLASDYPVIAFELEGGDEFELPDYFGLFHPEDLGDLVLMVRSPGSDILVDLCAAHDDLLVDARVSTEAVVADSG